MRDRGDGVLTPSTYNNGASSVVSIGSSNGNGSTLSNGSNGGYSFADKPLQVTATGRPGIALPYGYSGAVTLQPPAVVEKERKRKKKRPEPKVLDLDKMCGVEGPQIGPCMRVLTCKAHSIKLKRDVAGRSRPYDELLQALNGSRAALKLSNNNNSSNNSSSSSSSVGGSGVVDVDAGSSSSSSVYDPLQHKPLSIKIKLGKPPSSRPSNKSKEGKKDKESRPMSSTKLVIYPTSSSPLSAGGTAAVAAAASKGGQPRVKTTS